MSCSKNLSLIFRGAFQSAFINLSFAPASTLKHLYLCFLCAICGHRCVFHRQHADASAKLEKKQMLWIIGLSV